MVTAPAAASHAVAPGALTGLHRAAGAILVEPQQHRRQGPSGRGDRSVAVGARRGGHRGDQLAGLPESGVSRTAPIAAGFQERAVLVAMAADLPVDVTATYTPWPTETPIPTATFYANRDADGHAHPDGDLYADRYSRAAD